MLKCRVLGDTVKNQLSGSMDCRIKSVNDKGVIEPLAAADYLRKTNRVESWKNDVAQG